MTDSKTRPRRVYVGTEGDGPAYCDCGKDLEDVCHEDPREPCRATVRGGERRVDRPWAASISRNGRSIPGLDNRVANFDRRD